MSGKQKTTPGAGPRRMRGFERAARLVHDQIRKAGEDRGFAVTRLLTHWPDVVGADTAAIARPVKITYGRGGGIGATLTLLTTSARGPELAMQKESIRERVNACYGYNAISQIRITQTAPTGFAEGRAQFIAAPKVAAKPSPAQCDTAQSLCAGAGDAGLRQALEMLALNVLSRNELSKRQS
ncbi:MAG: DUF721 domain-containing protein [Paracoccaceae bacterium]